jgi:TolA-binding protein
VTALVLGATDALAQKGGEKDAGKGGKDAKVQKLSAGGPTLKYEQFRRAIEFKVAEKREEQIAGIKRLLDLGPAAEEMPDLKFRLAELYFDKSRFYFFRAQEADEKSTLSKSPGEKDALKSESKRHTQESKSWASQAVELYREIRDQYPKYKRMPEVLFALGQSYWSDGRFQSAIEVYADLIRNFKGSPLLSEAWLAFGEFYFQEGDVNKALKSYENAAEDKRSRVYGFALYKQAWCYYNMSKWNEALRKFEGTVVYSQLAAELSGENKIALGREAQKDYVRTYAHVGDPQRARFKFASLLGEDNCASKDCLTMLEQLAVLWSEEGYFEESAQLYKQLIATDPKNTRNPLFQGKIVDLVSKGQDKRRTIQETRRLVELYNQGKEYVATLVGKSEKEEQARENIKEAADLAETTVRKLGQVWNKEALKLRQKETYDVAKTMYEDYLKLFPSSTYAYEMRFQLGDLYYKLEKFDEAARAYEATVAAGRVKEKPQTQYMVEAANDNVLALEEHIKDLRLKNPKPSDKPNEIHPEKMRLIGACDRYVEVVPAEKAEKLVEVKFTAAKIYYDFSHYDVAIERFDQLVKAHPKSKQAEFAANLVIDVYNIRKDWERLYNTAAEYQRIPDLMEGRDQLAKDLAKFSEYAKFSLVQILEEKVKKERGDLRLVAQAYEDFAREFPKSENADKALYNASVAFDKTGEKAKAEDLQQRLLAEYPSSPLGTEVAFYVAKRLEERTQFADAADHFIAFARKYPDDSRTRDAMYNAAVFFAGVGQVRKANDLRLEYLKKYGKAKGGEKEASDIYWSIAQDLDRAGRWKEAATRYEEYAKEFRSDERFWDALWREATIRREKLGQRAPVEKIEGVILGTYLSQAKKGKDLPNNAKRYASLIAFERVDEEYSKYAKLRIPTPNVKKPQEFKRGLEDKAKARQKMIEAYTKIVTEYQQAESTIASLYRIALSWDEFVDKLSAVPCPRGIPEEACAIIKGEIDTMAAPAREAAYAAYQSCVVKSNELNTFTPYSTKCVKALEKLNPAAFPPMQEKSLDYKPGKDMEVLESNPLILEYDGFREAQQAQASVDGKEPKKEPKGP